MPAPQDVPLRCRCRCGRVRGVARGLSPGTCFRFLCYCHDCQAFARYLGRPDVLDAAGGTDIVHMPPARVKLVHGADQLRCLQLSPKVLRWYAGCCRTPIANGAASASFPAIAIIHSFMDHAADGRPRDQVVGPALCRIFERSATGPLPADAPPPPPLSLFVRRGSRLLGWWMRGLATPSPLFDARTQAPRAAPTVLTPGERAALP